MRYPSVLFVVSELVLIVIYYFAPRGKERDTKFGLACLINLRGIFGLVVINDDLTAGPGVVG